MKNDVPTLSKCYKTFHVFPHLIRPIFGIPQKRIARYSLTHHNYFFSSSTLMCRLRKKFNAKVCQGIHTRCVETKTIARRFPHNKTISKYCRTKLEDRPTDRPLLITAHEIAIAYDFLSHPLPLWKDHWNKMKINANERMSAKCLVMSILSQFKWLIYAFVWYLTISCVQHMI